MKRKNTRVRPRCKKAKGEVVEEESHEKFPYFANIPSHLTAQILLRLPITSLLICRFVCKIWKTLILEPHFAKLHFERSPSTFMIRTKDHRLVSRTLYLFDCESEKFVIGSNNIVKLDPIFKLPLRDGNSLREKIKNRPQRPIRAVRLVSEKKDRNDNEDSQGLNIDFKPYHDKFGILNSCNGLLCLSNLYNGNPVVICNPVIGEFIRLPEATKYSINKIRLSEVELVGSGFGFQSKTNEYKVIKIWKRFVRQADRRVFEHMILEVNTLGMPSWRNVEVDDPQVSISRLMYPTCANGALHWIRFEGHERSILCFCLESERFKSFPSPPHVFGNPNNGNGYSEFVNLGELRGLLYTCHISSSHNVGMWVMKEYGIGESWAKLCSIDTKISSIGRQHRHRYDYSLCWLLKHFDEGTILLYSYSNRLIYFEPKKFVLKVFQIHGTSSELVEIIPHVPSLISLKDVLKGENVEVLNIHSRCANVKLREENEVLSMSQLFRNVDMNDLHQLMVT